MAAAARLPEGHDRHGQRLVLRRRVHAARCVRSRDRRRRGDLRPLRGQLGHHSGRQRHEGDVRNDRAAQRALLCDDGRTVQGQAGRRDGSRQRVRAAQEAQEAHDRGRANAAREEPSRAARHQDRDEAHALHGLGRVGRLPVRQDGRSAVLRRERQPRERHEGVPRRQVVQARDPALQRDQK